MARYRTARPRLLWGGLGVAVVGLVVAAFAITGSRVYYLTFLPVFLAGVVLAVAGAAVAAYGRVGPTTKAEPLVPVGQDPDPVGEKKGPRLRANVACASCGTVFDVEGRRPLRATCPRCGQVGELPLDPGAVPTEG